MTLLKILGMLWATPHTLALGFPLLLAYGWGSDWRWENWCLKVTVKRAIGNPAAQTWGWLMLCVGDNGRRRVDYGDPDYSRTITNIDGSKFAPLARWLWRHECKHRWQAWVFGPVFPVAYGVEWVWRFAFNPGPVPELGRHADEERRAKRWYRAYHWLSWERWARSAE